MHCRGYFHRDIKPGNVIFNKETETYKLADFGETVKYKNKFVKLSSRDDCIEVLAGSRRFLDPILYNAWLMLNGLKDFDEMEETIFSFEKADVYSLGMLVLHVILSKNQLEWLKKNGIHDFESIKTMLRDCSSKYPFVSRLVAKMLEPN